ncbi:MAG: DNA polymerase IV, partial [Treponema sp.]|nr:DNA polymerase IV [Treponema sp.]
MADPFFLHIDLDAFFASVEQRDDPSLRGKPVIVGGLPCERRSVVSTASYEARKYGVHSAMSIQEAYKRCPNGIYLHGRMKRYLEVSNTIMNIFRSYSPVVEQLSIDEACIDLTGTSLLFGKESDTALKLKSEVREKTGLTVSCGLASTKYIAKLASEIHKPDGFFEVRQGFEKDFMLSLPLEKIWGLGPKTLARIRASGIHSTKDIFNKSKNLLVTLFGNSTGTFLYDVVRGNKIDTFARASNNHSISAETTFPYDLTDLYTAETCLMNLCHTIMFRMHSENVTSKTVFVKIRYDDFTTVSAQETFPFNINSIDELYEKAKKLFEKKYDISRSIRLLGLGVEKLRDSNKAKQEELFDFTETKQNKVEKTIVSISKKHPDVKIQKARLLKKIEMIIFALLISSFVKKGNPLFAQTNIESSGAASIITENIYAEEDALDTSESIFNFSLGKADVEFFAKGYWNAELVQSSIMTFGYGNSFAFSFGIPVFKQKVDLQLMLTLNKNYFFKADFADVFKKNTITLGYEGSGIIRNVLVSNRDIIFPDIYSSKEFKKSIRGGNNQSPGASIHLQGKKWRSDALIRYDMLQEKSATFYGKSQVTNSLLAISE